MNIKLETNKIFELAHQLNSKNMVTSYHKLLQITKLLKKNIDEPYVLRSLNLKLQMRNHHILVSSNAKRVEDYLWNLIMHSPEDAPYILGLYVLDLRNLIANPQVCHTTGMVILESGSAFSLKPKTFNKLIIYPLLNKLNYNFKY